MSATGEEPLGLQDPGELEQKALRLLVNREHSRAELARKLRKRGTAPDLVERVLDRLEERNDQNDRRFTEEYVVSRRSRGFGPNRIRVELAEKGVAPELIEECLSGMSPEWDLALQQAAQRRFGSEAATSYREWAKRARFLEYRGFPAEWIRKLLESE